MPKTLVDSFNLKEILEEPTNETPPSAYAMAVFNSISEAPDAADWFAVNGKAPLWINGVEHTSNGVVFNESSASSVLIQSIKTHKIVFAGDSITAGTGTTAGGNYFIAVAQRFAGVSNPNFVNAGVGGNTSAQILARFAADVIAQNPDAVHIMAGTNDAVVWIKVKIPASFQTTVKIAEVGVLNLTREGITL